MTSTRASRSRGLIGDLDLLAELWNQWHRAGQQIPAQHWDAPSGLGDWTVQELVAHVSRGVWTLADLVVQASPDRDPELPDASAYFSTLMGREDGAHYVAMAAMHWATTHSDSLVTDFDGPGTSVLAAARSVGSAPVPTIAGTMRLSDYVLTRVVEATVHLLDLGACTDAPEPSSHALHRTTDVLTDLTPTVDFIRLATGRPTCPVFPVLS